jgi:uncharacterized protein (DUF697 family)
MVGETADKSSWLMRKAESSLKRGFMQAYERVKVDPQEFLLHLQTAHGMPIRTYDGVYSVVLEDLDRVAEETVKASMKFATLEGAGLGIGGVLTLVPDLGILSAIAIRMIQKLSLLYGFQFNTDSEVADLWIAAASAAGVDISRELLEKEVVQRFVPKVIQRIAVQASADVVEKWAGRLIPVLSSVIGGALNYYFIKAWGERAVKHFREKHLERRARMLDVFEAPLLRP